MALHLYSFNSQPHLNRSHLSTVVLSSALYYLLGSKGHRLGGFTNIQKRILLVWPCGERISGKTSCISPKSSQKAPRAKKKQIRRGFFLKGGFYYHRIVYYSSEKAAVFFWCPFPGEAGQRKEESSEKVWNDSIPPFTWYCCQIRRRNVPRWIQ